ncbi:hypothetical protein [Mycobacterium antarcticum]|nr:MULTISPECIES: hypothetical protein [unclassified Mycolicibacterium]
MLDESAASLDVSVQAIQQVSHDVLVVRAGAAAGVTNPRPHRCLGWKTL